MSIQSNQVALFSKTKFSDAPTTRPLCPGSKKEREEMTLHFLSLFKLNCFTQNIFSLSLFEIEIKFSRLSSFLVSLSFFVHMILQKLFSSEKKENWKRRTKKKFLTTWYKMNICWSERTSLSDSLPLYLTLARTPTFTLTPAHSLSHSHTHAHALSHSNSHMVRSSPFAIIIRAFTVKNKFTFFLCSNKASQFLTLPSQSNLSFMPLSF